jgi:hypothetical protein
VLDRPISRNEKRLAKRALVAEEAIERFPNVRLKLRGRQKLMAPLPTALRWEMVILVGLCGVALEKSRADRSGDLDGVAINVNHGRSEEGRCTEVVRKSSRTNA